MNKLVEITWVDSKSYSNEWVSLEEVKGFKTEACSTVGYIVHEDELAYFVAQTRGEQGFYNIFLIPKGCVWWIEYCTDGEVPLSAFTDNPFDFADENKRD